MRRISGRELAEWAAFEELYGPIGIEARLDVAAALIAERITNCLTKSKGRPPTQDDFMPEWRRSGDLDAYDDGEGAADGERAP